MWFSPVFKAPFCPKMRYQKLGCLRRWVQLYRNWTLASEYQMLGSVFSQVRLVIRENMVKLSRGVCELVTLCAQASSTVAREKHITHQVLFGDFLPPANSVQTFGNVTSEERPSLSREQQVPSHKCFLCVCCEEQPLQRRKIKNCTLFSLSTTTIHFGCELFGLGIFLLNFWV